MVSRIFLLHVYHDGVFVVTGAPCFYSAALLICQVLDIRRTCTNHTNFTLKQSVLALPRLYVSSIGKSQNYKKNMAASKAFKVCTTRITCSYYLLC